MVGSCSTAAYVCLHWIWGLIVFSSLFNSEFVLQLDLRLPAKRRSQKCSEAVRGFCSRWNFCTSTTFRLSWAPFWRVNIVEWSFSTLAAALSTILKAYGVKPCKHVSLHETLKYLPQQPCCGLRPLRPTKLCLLLSSFRVRLFTVENHARRRWFFIGRFFCSSYLKEGTPDLKAQIQVLASPAWTLPVVVHLLERQDVLPTASIKASAARGRQAKCNLAQLLPACGRCPRTGQLLQA